MARRPSQTVVDYVVVGIAPALIIALVGSLAFFIIEVGYTGSFSTRLTAVTGFFVMGAVLVTRIAIEIDKERAQLYGLALAAVTFTAIVRFVDASLLLDFILIAVTWWCAHRLTYDCTVIEDNKTASGEGLLQTMGLDDAGESSQKENASVDVIATTDDIVDSEDDFATIWQRFVNRRKKHHSPGITVVYFSAAALPIFGIGQVALIAQGRNESNAAFRYMLLYVASALALLMATSFLQLRRYLRQRRLQMPIEMTCVWLGSGAVIVVLVMLFCLLMPRPKPRNSLLTTFNSVASRTGLTPSQWGVGQDGPESEDSDKQVTEPDSKNTRNGDGDSDGESESQDAAHGKSGEESAEEKAGNETSNDEGSRESGSERNDSTPRSQKDAQENDDAGDDNDSNSDTKKRPNASSRDATDSGNQQENTQPDSPSARNPIDGLQSLGNAIRQISRFAYYLLIVVIVCYAMIRYRSVIAKSLSQFWRDLRRLFGRKKTKRHEDARIEVAAPGLPSKSFSEYENPFQSGMVLHVSIAELVRYTFDAMEAWALDRECGRKDGETPVEFANNLARTIPDAEKHVKSLAMIYNQAAYSAESVGDCRKLLATLWQRMSK